MHNINLDPTAVFSNNYFFMHNRVTNHYTNHKLCVFIGKLNFTVSIFGMKFLIKFAFKLFVRKSVSQKIEKLSKN